MTIKRRRYIHDEFPINNFPFFIISTFSQDYETDSISSRSSESGGDNQDALSFPQQLGLMKLKNEGKNSRRESQDVQEPSPHPKRYLQCPANVNVSHLKKFIKMKYYLTDKEQVRFDFFKKLNLLK